MSDSDQESTAARLQRLRDLRDRGPVSGSPGVVDPEEMQAKRERLRQVRDNARSEAGPPAIAAPAAARRTPPAAPGRGSGTGAGAGGDQGRQIAARFLGALHGGGTTIPGTDYTEEGVGNFVAMLKSGANERPFFDRVYKSCIKPAEPGEQMFNDVNLTGLARAVELFEQIQSEGLTGVRDQQRGGGQAGRFGGAPGGGPGGFAGPTGQGGGGRGASGFARALRGQGGGGGPGGMLRRSGGAGEIGEAAQGRPPGATADAAQLQELRDRVARLERAVGELKAQLEKK